MQLMMGSEAAENQAFEEAGWFVANLRLCYRKKVPLTFHILFSLIKMFIIFAQRSVEGRRLC